MPHLYMRRIIIALTLFTIFTPLLEAQVAPEGVTLRKRHRRAYDFWFKRAYPGDTIPDGALQKALQQADALRPRVPQGVGGPGERWVNIGPMPMFSTTLVPVNGGYSGRISCMAVNPANTNHWLVGPNIGGVWETKDAGLTWAPISDYEANLSMGAIAFAPSDTNTVYVGTGEGHGSNSYPGAGLLKSTDGGRTWTLLATNVFGKASFSDIKVSPTDKNLLYAASLPSGNSDGVTKVLPSPQTGFHRSTDGGQTWARTLDGNDTDIEVHPTDFTRLLTAMGNSRGDNATNDVYRSTDGGLNWTKLVGPWVSSNAAGRIEIAIAPSNPDVSYVSVHDFTKKPNLLGVWKSADIWGATPTWTKLNQPPAPIGDQWDYDHDIIVHPTDANVVFLGGVAVFRLDGANWTPVGGHYDPQNRSIFIHPDQQAFAWAGTRLVVGNDGGVFSTLDYATNWNNHNTTLATIQVYHGSVHPTRADHAIIGAQDNSCSYWRGTNSFFQELTGGDGTDSAYSRQNPDTKWLYADQQLAIYRTTDGGINRSDATTGLPSSGAPFVGRIVISPFNEDVALVGHTNLFRCNDVFSGANPTWVMNGPKGIGFTTQGSVSAIAIAPSDNTGNTYAFGTESGELRLTTTGGRENGWRLLDDIGAPKLPGRYVNNIAFHPTDPNTIYVVFSGFISTTTQQEPNRLVGHVFRTQNALASPPTWTRIGPDVDIPHNAIAIDPSNPLVMYLANDLGVWRSVDAGASWTQLGQSYGFPNVPVFDIEINSVGRVIAFTHGRSAFTLIGDSERRLATAKTGSDLLVSFSALALYPVLQTTTSLQGTPVWTNAGNLTLSGTNYFRTNAIGDTARYFRLQTK